MKKLKCHCETIEAEITGESIQKKMRDALFSKEKDNYVCG